MAKIKQMGDGIVVKDAPDHRPAAGALLAKGKRTSSGKSLVLVAVGC